VKLSRDIDVIGKEMMLQTENNIHIGKTDARICERNPETSNNEPDWQREHLHDEFHNSS
jgi:hypothetical protein